MPLPYLWFIINWFMAVAIHGNYRRRTGKDGALAFMWGVATFFFGIFVVAIYFLVCDTYVRDIEE